MLGSCQKITGLLMKSMKYVTVSKLPKMSPPFNFLYHIIIKERVIKEHSTSDWIYEGIWIVALLGKIKK